MIPPYCRKVGPLSFGSKVSKMCTVGPVGLFQFPTTEASSSSHLEIEKFERKWDFEVLTAFDPSNCSSHSNVGSLNGKFFPN